MYRQPHPAAITAPLEQLITARRTLHRIADQRPLGDHLAAALADVTALLARDSSSTTLLERIWTDCLADIAGQPGSGLGSSGGGSGGHSDPTSRGATSTDRGAPDRLLIAQCCGRIAARTRAAITDHSTHVARSIHDDTDTLMTIASKRTAHQATPRDRRTSADGEQGCEACAKVSLWSPVYGTSWQPPRDHAGATVPDPVELCRACYRRAMTTGQVPTTDELEHKRDHPRGHWPKVHVDPTTIGA